MFIKNNYSKKPITFQEILNFVETQIAFGRPINLTNLIINTLNRYISQFDVMTRIELDNIINRHQPIAIITSTDDNRNREERAKYEEKKQLAEEKKQLEEEKKHLEEEKKHLKEEKKQLEEGKKQLEERAKIEEEKRKTAEEKAKIEEEKAKVAEEKAKEEEKAKAKERALFDEYKRNLLVDPDFLKAIEAEEIVEKAEAKKAVAVDPVIQAQVDTDFLKAIEAEEIVEKAEAEKEKEEAENAVAIVKEAEKAKAEAILKEAETIIKEAEKEAENEEAMTNNIVFKLKSILHEDVIELKSIMTEQTNKIHHFEKKIHDNFNEIVDNFKLTIKHNLIHAKTEQDDKIFHLEKIIKKNQHKNSIQILAMSQRISVLYDRLPTSGVNSVNNSMFINEKAETPTRVSRYEKETDESETDEIENDFDNEDEVKEIDIQFSEQVIG
jgi:hypothetical protein